MEPDRLALLLSTLCFLGGFLYAVHQLRGRGRPKSLWNLVPNAAGFAFQSVFLYLRGQQHGRCPITDGFEVLIFICWSAVLLFFVVGSVFRLSLLGVFTAPMVFIFQTAALLFSPAVVPSSPPPTGKVDPWLEIHAGLSLMAYGAFALACVAGVMFLVQERLLKRHKIGSLFHHLPSISYLSKAIFRLFLIGLLFLSVGIAAAYGMAERPSGLKLALAYAVWVLYAFLTTAQWLHRLEPRLTAWISVVGFCLPLFTLLVISRHA